jgi:hypothetical protein
MRRAIRSDGNGSAADQVGADAFDSVKMERTRASHMICVGERINVSEWCILWCFHSLQWELASIQRFGGLQMKQPDEQHASSKQRSKVG